MKQKRILLCSFVALAAVAFSLFFALRGVRHARAAQPTGQASTRKVTYWTNPTAPAEVSALLLNDTPLRTGDGIQSGMDWIGNLQVKFKNRSDKPISFARFMLFDASRPNTSSLMFIYGKEHSVDTTDPTVAPGEYGIARPDIAMFGSTSGTTELKLQVNKVVLDFNYDLIWNGGSWWELDTSPNAPQKYKKAEAQPTPTPTPQAKASRLGQVLFTRAKYSLTNLYSRPAAALSDPCEDPFTPGCEEQGQFCQDRLSDANATATCSSNNACGGAGQPHCFNSGCHPTGPAYCFRAAPQYSGINRNANKVTTMVGCYDSACPTNLCGDNVNHSGYVLAAASFPDENCIPVSSPIIIDLEGDGIKLTSAKDGVRFDLNINGKYEQVAWTMPGEDDAFLALDRNGDGRIKTGAELFGDVTEQPPTANNNGFSALKVFDANGDNQISAADPVYSQLRLWTDSNHDGRSEQGELATLSARGVKSIGTDFKDSRKTDQYGNEFRYRAKVIGTKGQPFAYDVFLSLFG
jgi:hypothetical protein